MPESGSSGSVRGALRNERPYRERGSFPPKTEDVLVAATYGKYSLSLA